MALGTLRATILVDDAKRIHYGSDDRVSGRIKITYEASKALAQSNTALFAGLGLAVVGGVAFYVYTSQSDTAREAGSALRSGAQAAKSVAHFVPTKADYQKVISLRI